MGQFQYITLERRADGVALLTLNRPEKLNAFDRAMIDEWQRALGVVKDDAATSVLVLTGAGRAFCAGGDADDMLRLEHAGNIERREYLRNIHRIPLALESLDKPVIAAINGAARGAGMDMALMCDLRVAAASATFAESYINLGLVPGDGGMYFLPRLIGTARALELLWTGRAIDAPEAERIGLISRVVPDSEVLAAALQLAAVIAAQPQEAIRICKRGVYQSLSGSLAAHLDAVASHMAVLYDTPEFRARLKAFRERRK
ncbi:MAG: enoyl-CoA hydratase [Betaproteobacteria bacterium]|nr:MAG: enoyl-CoA hydratase [Betaproteobacteria bacterium]